MTDLEITKLCAEAMFADKYQQYPEEDTPVQFQYFCDKDGNHWNPLHDDAQAMALVKKFEISLTKDVLPEEWRAESGNDGDAFIGRSPDLNRAICECVAKMKGSSAPT